MRYFRPQWNKVSLKDCHQIVVRGLLSGGVGFVMALLLGSEVYPVPTVSVAIILTWTACSLDELLGEQRWATQGPKLEQTGFLKGWRQLVVRALLSSGVGLVIHLLYGREIDPRVPTVSMAILFTWMACSFDKFLGARRCGIMSE